jgi:UDP:flavonoid glycosyltransferase YjiC (YdhE family)
MLLPKADVFITNGGSGGTHHGLGIDLQTATPTPQAVDSAAESLLHDARVRENVARLAKVYAEHDALETIEQLLLR